MTLALENNSMTYLQIFGSGALANEIKFGLISNAYSAISPIEITTLKESDQYNPSFMSVLGMQDPIIKKRLFESLPSDAQSNFATLIHNKAIVFPNVTVGLGTVINANVIVSYGVNIGLSVLLNWNVTVGHEVEIGNYTSVGPGSNISGGVKIGNQSFLGAGTVILPGIKIGDNVRVGAGAVVTKDLPSNVTAVGVPARFDSPNGIESKWCE